MSPALRLALLAAAAAGAVGCSNPQAVDEDGNDGIYGSWTSTRADGGSTVRVTFTSARTYSLEELGDSAGTDTEAHEETGTFSVGTGVITWMPERSSCAAPEATYQSAYDLSGTTLSIALPDDILALHASRDDDDADAGAPLTLGCFTADGGFTASPLTTLSR